MALYTMRELLADAQARGYGVGFFNAVNLEMIRACVEAAEQLRSPIILGTAEALLPVAPFEWIVPPMLEAARRAKVPVAVHLDHTYRFETLMQALRAGFGSIMYDGSRESHENNIEHSAQIARVAHAMGVGLECELGSVSGLTDEAGHEDAMVYTDPAEAADFLERTGADFLAVSIGTQHGVYKAKPRLDIPRLKAIRAAVDAPLVLHGGSGLSDEDFRETIAGGIAKVNVFTDVILAGRRALCENPEASYPDGVSLAREAMTRAVAEKLRLFGSAGRA
ncbi:MAG TPA: class II fructose-bisphosphate aldolase [Candidatus Pullichristensenella avicola]|nr:class II fructose-bisphosphate aldolase [Candidatus Pullichristensenella avicola]